MLGLVVLLGRGVLVQQAILLTQSQFRFIADPQGKFTKELDLAFDGTAIFGNERSKRYALLIDGGKVVQKFVEPDNTGIEASKAEKVLSSK